MYCATRAGRRRLPPIAWPTPWRPRGGHLRPVGRPHQQPGRAGWTAPSPASALAKAHAIEAFLQAHAETLARRIG
ncbi:hypothetical protein ACU4GD_06995 [Cupriavidus basilensis]